MTYYPEKISRVFHQPKNTGKAENANATATSASFVCGAGLRLSLWIEVETKEILEAKFLTNGCGFLIASADVLAGKIKGLRLTELHGLDDDFLRSEIESELGEFEERRIHCLELCLQTLQDTLANFRLFQIEEFTGEKALICTCFGVAEETIEKVIAENELETVEEVGDACNAGTGCGSCQPLIEEILSTKYSGFE